jgi:NRAMP (natural resistance-associated macrophage protein)-like metal ion transporter
LTTKQDKSNDSVHPLPRFIRSLGPGFVTGAADIDPSTIATYIQAGAKFGLGLIWMILFQLPSMIAIQEMCARLGLTTGKGLAQIIKIKYSNRIVIIISGLLFFVNTINIGADLGAMGASVNILIPETPAFIPTIMFSVVIVLAEIAIPYRIYVTILKYLALALLSYVVTAIIVGGNWTSIFISTLTPHVQLTPDFAIMFVAVFGTTFPPYLFFWQTSEEVEEDVKKGKIPEIGKGKPHLKPKEIKLMKRDVALGMFFSQIMVWAIIVTASGSLHAHNLTNVQSASEAAKALEPLVKSFPGAGQISKAIFALGIIGTGMLAIPVLAGSSAYALSDAFGWRQGLNEKFTRAKKFYFVIITSTVIGLWITFSNINIIQVLILTAVISAVAGVPILYMLMRIANDKKILQNRTNGLVSNIIGWSTFVLMAVSVIILFIALTMKAVS